jgi:hypothetical protein
MSLILKKILSLWEKSMTHNSSLELSLLFREQLHQDLFPVIAHDFPQETISSYMEEKYKEKSARQKPRDKVYTVSSTLFTMLLTSVQEDKSMQQSVNLFRQVYAVQSYRLREEEAKKIEEEQARDKLSGSRSGRPKLYKSKLPKSKTNVLSSSPVAYSNARGRLPLDLVQLVFECSADFGVLSKEEWHGLKTYITDGTYIQLQDTEAIRAVYPPMEGNGMFPQALLQVFIRQGSGQISQYALGSRKQSELQLVIPMIEQLKEGDLLLADDLYNTYYHFSLILAQKAHIIVPGKRERNYRLIHRIGQGDEIVEISKGRRPEYVSRQEWKSLPDSIRLRRITYTYQTKEGNQEAVLYTTLQDEQISAADIVLKYAGRWDIEISIREIKTLMDINVLRSKTPEMLQKELGVSLTAYNMVRKIIARSSEKAGFSPQENIFQKCAEISRPLLLDKKGRVFHRWSPGRYGKSVRPDQ